MATERTQADELHRAADELLQAAIAARRYVRIAIADIRAVGNVPSIMGAERTLDGLDGAIANLQAAL